MAYPIHEIDQEAQEQIDLIYVDWKNKLEKVGETDLADVDLFLKNCDRDDLIKIKDLSEKIHTSFQQERRAGIHYKFDPKVTKLFEICEDAPRMIQQIDTLIAIYKEQAKTVEHKLQVPRGIEMPVEAEKIAVLALPKRLSYNNLIALDIAQAVRDVLDKTFDLTALPIATLRMRRISLDSMAENTAKAILCRRFVLSEVEKHEGEKRIQDRSGKVYSEPLTQIQHYGKGFRAKNIGINQEDLLLNEGSMVTFNDGSLAKIVKLQQYKTAPHEIVFKPDIGGKEVEITVGHQMHLKDLLGLKPVVTPD